MNATHEAGVGELAFMSDYAKEHNLSFGGSAQLAENQAASHSSMSEAKTAETETPKKTTPQYSASRSRVNDDDVYAFTFYNEARGNLAVVMKPNNTILEGMRPKLNPSIQIQVVKLLRNVQ